MNNKEIRQLDSEFRTIDDSRNIEGYSLKFNLLSQKMGNFTEKIDPHSLDGVLEQSDVFCLFDHDPKQVLARSLNNEGSLNLEVDSIGLKYSFEAPQTELGDNILEGVKRQDIRHSSFAFSVAKNGEKWETLPDGSRIRTILKFDKIFDVSPVYHPAYLDTTVAQRSLDKLIEEENKQIEEEKQEIVEEKVNEIEVKDDNNDNDLLDYYAVMEEKISNL